MPSIAAMARILRVGGTETDFGTLENALRGVGQSDLKRVTVAQALEAIESRGVDLLLVDLTLPGPDIVALIRAASPGGGARSRVPVIVTAPDGIDDRIETCLRNGAEDYVSTPFDPQRPLLLARRVQLCLQRRWLRDASVRLRARSSEPEETAVLELYNNASNRFVPREFLEHLGRKSLTDVRLGDHVERDMSVLFTDIRDFTTLSESLSPQENFDFLNSYLRQVTPIIRAHHGFVDKYIGDAIMALFPRSASDALQAAIKLQERVKSYNLGRHSAGYVPIQVGLGLHRGKCILGTIGEDERMQTTVIADAVNVASRIEGLTKTFGVSLLVSGAVIDALSPHQREKHHLRPLGAVKAKGKTRSVEIFECFDNDPEDLAAHKEKTAEAFDTAMTEFRKGMFLTAGRIFARIAEMNPRDSVAAHYRDSCTLTVVRDRGAVPWDGAETIEVK
jgi:class 3 adenylate cyclase